MTLDDTLHPGLKGYPHDGPVIACAEVGRQGWNLLAGDLPLPLAVLRRDALEHNVQWMQQQVRAWGVDIAPHGKTTMSPQLFTRQLAAGAWGITFATVTQLAVGVAAGLKRALIANQVLGDADLAAIARWLERDAGLRVLFLVDSAAQLALIEAFAARHRLARPFEVLLEIGVPGGRTGCRSTEEALALAARLSASAAVRLAGIECYEGLAARSETGGEAANAEYVDTLMQRVQKIASAIDERGGFAGDEVIVSAGGSALFDMVAPRLRLSLRKPVRALLRSGCYVTHDDGHYKRLVHAVERRLQCAAGSTLRPAIEIWAHVQSQPEPGLALLTAGRRDVSFDIALPTPLKRAPLGSRSAQAVPPSWRIAGLNDQHAHLRWDGADAAAAPRVGERIALGISHPCTTFDKWGWMAIVDDDYRVVDALRTYF
jgi:D-serine dehydratase